MTLSHTLDEQTLQHLSRWLDDDLSLAETESLMQELSHIDTATLVHFTEARHQLSGHAGTSQSFLAAVRRGQTNVRSIAQPKPLPSAKSFWPIPSWLTARPFVWSGVAAAVLLTVTLMLSQQFLQLQNTTPPLAEQGVVSEVVAPEPRVTLASVAAPEESIVNEAPVSMEQLWLQHHASAGSPLQRSVLGYRDVNEWSPQHMQNNGFSLQRASMQSGAQ